MGGGGGAAFIGWPTADAGPEAGFKWKGPQLMLMMLAPNPKP